MTPVRILCAVDESERSSIVLRHGFGLAAGQGAALSVLTVIEPLLSAAASLTRERGRLEREILDDLRQLTATIAAPPALQGEPECAVRVGPPHTEILDACREGSCSTIVMGTHGHRGLTKLFLGSTLERVLRATRVPVLTVPPTGPGLAAGDDGRLAIALVIAAIDFEPPSMHAARAAAAIAARHGAPLRLLHAAKPTPHRGWLTDAIRTADRTRAERAEREIQALAAEIAAGGPPTTAVVLGGEADEILSAQASAQPGTLLVMGLRGAAPDSALPGSTAYRVLSLSTAPVLVVPS